MAYDKIVDSGSLDSGLTSIANAIRTKGGTSASLAFPTGFVNAIGAIPTGGGGAVEEKDVNFIDYDGTILHSYTKAEITAMTSESDLPSNPSHTGLTAQGWNWTLAQIKAQLTAAGGVVNVGQMYTTSSGSTEIDVVMQDGRLSPTLTIAVKGTVTVDWGDNTTADTVTGNSLTSRKAASHTYASAGEYTIKITIGNSTSEFSFYCTSSYVILRKATSLGPSKVYLNCIREIRLGPGITTIADYAFYYCTSLKYITIPKGITSVGNSSFLYCDLLEAVVLPDTLTYIGGSFSYDRALSRVSIPSTVTHIGNSAFTTCYVLNDVTIPVSATLGQSAFSSCYKFKHIITSAASTLGNSAFSSCETAPSITILHGVTSIGTSSFASCPAAITITIPSSVTSIGSKAFQYCYGAKEYHVKPTSPPTLASDSLNGIESDCIIYVPYSSDHSVLNTYKGASQWSNYASQIQEEPQ